MDVKQHLRVFTGLRTDRLLLLFIERVSNTDDRAAPYTRSVLHIFLLVNELHPFYINYTPGIQ